MCGFAGFLSKNNISENLHVLLKKMGMAIEHRGPDSAGEWLLNIVHLARETMKMDV